MLPDCRLELSAGSTRKSGKAVAILKLIMDVKPRDREDA